VDVYVSLCSNYLQSNPSRASQALPTFAVVSGPCTVTSGGSCFRSANYPNHYGDNEQCEITVLGSVVHPTVATVGFARATTFETESAAYDYLTIGSTTNPVFSAISC
jgi:hypothetical protein